MRALGEMEQDSKIYVPFGTNRNEIVKLQADGYRTIQGLDKNKDAAVEAARMECELVWLNGQIEKV